MSVKRPGSNVQMCSGLYTHCQQWRRQGGGPDGPGPPLSRKNPFFPAPYSKNHTKTTPKTPFLATQITDLRSAGGLCPPNPRPGCTAPAPEKKAACGGCVRCAGRVPNDNPYISCSPLPKSLPTPLVRMMRINQCYNYSILHCIMRINKLYGYIEQRGYVRIIRSSNSRTFTECRSHSSTKRMV